MEKTELFQVLFNIYNGNDDFRKWSEIIFFKEMPCNLPALNENSHYKLWRITFFQTIRKKGPEWGGHQPPRIVVLVANFSTLLLKRMLSETKRKFFGRVGATKFKNWFKVKENSDVICFLPSKKEFLYATKTVKNWLPS